MSAASFYRFLLLAALLAFDSASRAVVAQSLPAVPAPGGAAQTPRHPLDPAELPLLPGLRCAVRYTPGYLDRAHHVLLRLEVLNYYFHKWSALPTPVAAYVLSRDDWARVGLARPYGFPSRTGRTGLAVPAIGDDETVELWRQLLATRRLPMEPGIPIQGTSQQAASLALVDIFLQVETARGFVARRGLLGDVRWVGEVLAHLAAHTVFHLQERSRLAEIETLYARLSQLGGGPGAMRLSRYRPDLPLAEWLWFHAQFSHGARVIFEKDGKGAIKRLIKMNRKARGQIDQQMLLRAYPGLEDWLRTSFNHAPPGGGTREP